MQINTRRKFLSKLGLLGAMAATTQATQACSPGAGNEATFLHMVFFWLVDDNPATRSQFETELRTFISGVKEIKSVHIGTPAGTDRDVIDNSWDFSLVLGFENKTAQDIYQEHPLHRTFIENASMLWERVLVYDSVNT